MIVGQMKYLEEDTISPPVTLDQACFLISSKKGPDSVILHCILQGNMRDTSLSTISKVI
jgi:hypothetical protein